jgi:hypothetical protein
VAQFIEKYQGALSEVNEATKENNSIIRKEFL